MAITIFRRTKTAKPQAAIQIDWGNPISRGLVGYWSLANYSGSKMADSAKYGDGTLGGGTGTPTWESRERSLDLLFNSSNTQYVNVPDNPSLRLNSGFSVEIYFYLNSNHNYNGMFEKVNSNIANPVDIYINGLGEIVQFIGNGSTFSGFPNLAVAVPGLKWHQYIMGYNAGTGGGFSVFDGQVTQYAAGTVTVTGVDSTNALRFGSRADAATALDGRLSYVRLWNRALDVTEGVTLFNHPYDLVAKRQRFWPGGGAVITGTGASSFHFASAATGKAGSIGPATSSFHFASAATGKCDPRGAVANSFHFASAATGHVANTSGTSTASFHFAARATAFESPIHGSSAASFHFASAAIGVLPITGTAASSFPFASSAFGTARTLGPTDGGNLSVFVNGVLVPCEEGSISVDWKFQQRATAEFTMLAGSMVAAVANATGYRPQVGQTVLIIDTVPPAGIILKVAIHAPGFGYSAGTTVAIIQPGTKNNATYMVDTVDGSGHVLTGHLVGHGFGYLLLNENLTVDLGPHPGTGLTLDILKLSFSGPVTIFGGTIDEVTESSLFETEGNPITAQTAPSARSMDCKCVSFEQRLDKRYTPGSSQTNLGSGRCDVFHNIPSTGLATLTTNIGAPPFTDEQVGKIVVVHDNAGHRIAAKVQSHPTSQTVVITDPDLLAPSFGTLASYYFPSPGTVFRSFSGYANVDGSVLTLQEEIPGVIGKGDAFDPALLRGPSLFIEGNYYPVMAVNGYKAVVNGTPPVSSGASQLTAGYFSNMGSNYEVGDVLDIGDGTAGSGAQIMVDSVHPYGYPNPVQGAIGAWHIVAGGTGYGRNFPESVSGGHGSGAEFYCTGTTGVTLVSWASTWAWQAVFTTVCIQALAQEGIDTGNIVPAGPISSTLIYDNTRVSDALDDLATRANYVWYIDPTPVPPQIHFVPKQSLAPPYSVTDAGLIEDDVPITVYRNIQTDITRVDVRNAEWVKIAVTAVTDEVGSSEEDTQRSVLVNYPIASIVNVNGGDTNVGVWEVDTDKNWYFSPGFSIVYRDKNNTAAWQTVTYAPAFQDTIVAQDTAGQTARAAIEGGSGIYEHQTDLTQSISDAAVGDGGGDFATGPGWTSAASWGNTLVSNNEANVTKVTFECDSPGFLPGQLLAIQNSARNIDGNFLIDEIQFSEIRRAGGPTGEYFSGVYQITALSNELQNWLAVFIALTRFGTGSNTTIGGGGGAITSAGPFNRTILLRDLLPGTDIGDNIPVFVAGTVTRVIAVLRKTITADLVVTLTLNNSLTPAMSITVPAATAVRTPVVVVPSPAVALADLDVIVPNVAASDSSFDADGVCSVTVEWA